jgi:hypothetical protein
VGACPNCWRAWLYARPRTELGYCWHGKIAWRLKPDAELAVVAGVTRDEHRTMLEYVNEMESAARFVTNSGRIKLASFDRPHEQ